MKRIFILIIITLYTGVVFVNAQECEDGYATCADGSCIPEDWVCDGENDCGDNSDEPDTCPMCPIHEFQCKNGKCIPPHWICDGGDDCGDMSDERDPATGLCPPCGDSLFQCANGRCISKNYLCDGQDNCGDNSDELNDPKECPPCSPDQWQCKNGKCIYKDYTCDDDNDCLDWSDESDETCPCSEGKSRCGNVSEEGQPGPCIPSEWFCDEDGIWDCPGGDDEANCTASAVNRKMSPKNIKTSHSSGMHWKSKEELVAKKKQSRD